MFGFKPPEPEFALAVNTDVFLPSVTFTGLLISLISQSRKNGIKKNLGKSRKHIAEIAQKNDSALRFTKGT